MKPWERILVAAFWLGVLVCMGLAIVNAVLYLGHPHGRDLNLFAAIWCTLMAVIVLYWAMRVTRLTRET